MASHARRSSSLWGQAATGTAGIRRGRRTGAGRGPARRGTRRRPGARTREAAQGGGRAPVRGAGAGRDAVAVSCGAVAASNAIGSHGLARSGGAGHGLARAGAPTAWCGRARASAVTAWRGLGHQMREVLRGRLKGLHWQRRKRAAVGSAPACSRCAHSTLEATESANTMVAILLLLPSNIHENAMNRTSTCMLHLAPLFLCAASRHPAWPQRARERRRRSRCLMSQRHGS